MALLATREATRDPLIATTRSAQMPNLNATSTFLNSADHVTLGILNTVTTREAHGAVEGGPWLGRTFRLLIPSVRASTVTPSRG